MSTDVAAIVAAALLGLLIGSFLNVLIWRVPRGESVVAPPSACPGCGKQIAARDNVPVLSWIVLRGRCRHCQEPISKRYPMVELLTAAVFAGVVYQLGVDWATPAYLYGAAIAIALTVIDIDTHRLPDAIVIPSYPVVAGLLALAGAGSGDWSSFGRALLGGLILLVAYALMWFAYPQGMGFGDVKLAGIVGMLLAWLGWGALVIGAFGAFLLGGVFSIGLLMLRRAGRKTGIPFGPWMIAGAVLGVLWGERIWAAYLGAFT